MTRQVTDNLYIDLEYFTPEEYYTYEAEAEIVLGSEAGFECVAETSATVSFEAALTSEFSTSTAAQRVAGLSVDLVSEFTQTAVISHIEGADLFAFTEASLAAAVDRIRDNNIEVTAVFDVGVDAVRIQQSDALVSSDFTVSAQAQRSKSLESAMNAAFSFTAQGQRVSRVAIAFDTATNGEITTAQKKFGAGSAGLKSTFTTTAETTILQTTVSALPDPATYNWTLDYWRYQSAVAQGVYSNHLILAPAGMNLRLRHRSTENGNQFNIEYTRANNTVSNNESLDNIVVPVAQWNHYRLTRQGETITLWLNGTKIVSALFVSSPRLSGLPTTPARFYAYGAYSTRQTYLDEVRLYTGNLTDKDTATFTPPSQAFDNDTSTLFLLHLDTNTLDDNLLTIRNPGAVNISSAATLSADAQQFIGTSAALSTTATLSAQSNTVIEAQISMLAMASQLTAAIKNVNELADFTSSFTLTALGGILKDSSVALTSQFTLTAQALDLDLATANLVSQTTLTATLTGNPSRGRANLVSQSTLACDARVNLNPNQIVFDPTQRSIQQFVPGALTYTIPEIGTQDFIISFLVDYGTVTLGGDFDYPPSTDWLFIGGTNLIDIRNDQTGGFTPPTLFDPGRALFFVGSTYYSTILPNDLSTGQYRVIIQRKNGLRYLTLPGTITSEGNELNGSSWTSNFTGTTVTIGDTTDGDGLGQWPFVLKDFYFEIDGDRFYPPEIASADLFTQAALSFEGIIVKFGEADLQSQAQLQANLGLIKRSPVSLTSSSNVVAVAEKLVIASSALTTSATLNCQANFIADNTASLQVQSTQVIDNTRIRFADSALEVVAEQTVDNSRLRDNTVTISSEFTLSAEPLRIKTSAVSFESIASQLSVAVKVGQALVTLETVSTLTAQAEYTARPVIELVSAATVEVESTVTVQGRADITSEFTVIAGVDKIKPMGAELFSAFAANVSAIKTTDIVENFAAESNFAVAEQRFRDFDSAISSEFTVDVTALKARTLQATVNSEFTILASPFNIVQGSANLQSQGFVLTAGRVLNLDPYLTYIIPEETRYYVVTEESREFKINQETRTLIL